MAKLMEEVKTLCKGMVPRESSPLVNKCLTLGPEFLSIGERYLHISDASEYLNGNQQDGCCRVDCLNDAGEICEWPRLNKNRISTFEGLHQAFQSDKFVAELS